MLSGILNQPFLFLFVFLKKVRSCKNDNNLIQIAFLFFTKLNNGQCDVVNSSSAPSVSSPFYAHQFFLLASLIRTRIPTPIIIRREDINLVEVMTFNHEVLFLSNSYEYAFYTHSQSNFFDDSYFKQICTCD